MSYRSDIFEDVFGYTVLRIYDAIVYRGLKVGDYEQYFYKASKLNYIKREDRVRKRQCRLRYVGTLPEVSSGEAEPLSGFMDELRDELSELFGEDLTGQFLRYIEGKAREGQSCRAFAEREGLNVGYITRQFGKIKKYLRN